MDPRLATLIRNEDFDSLFVEGESIPVETLANLAKQASCLCHGGEHQMLAQDCQELEIAQADRYMSWMSSLSVTSFR